MSAAAYDCLTFYHPSRDRLDIPQLCQQAAKELLPGGILSIRDWLVPGSQLRGKKARLQNQAGAYVNTFLAFVWGDHDRVLSQHQWESTLQQSGFHTTQCHIQPQKIHFQEWTVAADLSQNDRIRAEAMLIQAPTAVLEYLTPQIAGDRITFQLQEIHLIGRLSSIQ